MDRHSGNRSPNCLVFFDNCRLDPTGVPELAGQGNDGPKRTRPRAQYNASGLASPGH
jgi:hypothetical protein